MSNIAVLYFSGTNNTRFIAHQLFHKFVNDQVVLANITKEYDFDDIINNSDMVFICYPVYGSSAPMIVEDFVYQHKDVFKDKNVGVIITQGGFSGDGAYYLCRILKKLGAKIVASEHFTMPDNLYDVAKKPYTKQEISKLLNKVGKKLDIFVERYYSNKPIKRGSVVFSRMIGSVQRRAWKLIYPKVVARLKIDSEKCVGCGWCASNCPTNNLTIRDNKAVKSDKCTLCYRCVNGCPQKAISIFGNETKIQYKGINEKYRVGK